MELTANFTMLKMGNAETQYFGWMKSCVVMSIWMVSLLLYSLHYTLLSIHNTLDTLHYTLYTLSTHDYL